MEEPLEGELLEAVVAWRVPCVRCSREHAEEGSVSICLTANGR